MADRICDEVANGSNLNKIAKEDWSPARSEIYRWLRENEEFSDNYARAREDRADYRADRVDEICEKVEKGDLDPQSARVIIDALKWQAGKEKPKAYGDKVQHVGGDDSDAPIRVERIERVIVDPKEADPTDTDAS